MVSIGNETMVLVIYVLLLIQDELENVVIFFNPIYNILWIWFLSFSIRVKLIKQHEFDKLVRVNIDQLHPDRKRSSPNPNKT